MKPKTFYYISAALCLLGIVIHEFAGAPQVLPPLHQTDLPNSVIWLHYFSWLVLQPFIFIVGGVREINLLQLYHHWCF